MSNSFTQKEIEIQVMLGQGTFANNGNTKVMRGYACQVNVQKVGIPDKNKAIAKIYGISIDDMAQMTTLAFKPLESQKNVISISAGDLGQELTQIFVGEIITAWADFNTAPDITFTLEAMAGYYPSLKPLPPTASNGQVLVKDVLFKLAGQAGYTFVDQGVTQSVRNIYLTGSPIEQAREVARQAGIQLVIDDLELIALPPDKAREGNTVILNKETGLIGYPTFNADGIVGKCFFEPALQYGGLVKIESIVPKATGVWKVTKLTHAISAKETGAGAWETSFEGTYYDS